MRVARPVPDPVLRESAARGEGLVGCGAHVPRPRSRGDPGRRALRLRAAHAFSSAPIRWSGAPREFGIAALAIVNAYNIAGALARGRTSRRARDLVAFAFTAALQYVAPAGGTRPGLRHESHGVRLAAGGDGRRWSSTRRRAPARAARSRSTCATASRSPRAGRSVPTVSRPPIPATALAGAQLPFGGHKGAAIALMVELLAGALIGDVFSFEAHAKDAGRVGAPCGGEFMIAIDPHPLHRRRRPRRAARPRGDALREGPGAGRHAAPVRPPIPGPRTHPDRGASPSRNRCTTRCGDTSTAEPGGAGHVRFRCVRGVAARHVAGIHRRLSRGGPGTFAFGVCGESLHDTLRGSIDG